MRDSAIMDGPMSNGLGINQTNHQAHMLSHDFAMNGNQLVMNSMTSLPMQQQRSQQQHSLNQDNSDAEDSNRRTLTQAQFDAFGQAIPYGQDSNEQVTHNMSATITNPSEIYGQFDYPELCNFDFDTANPDDLSSTPMQPSLSTDSYMSNTATHTQNEQTPTSSSSHQNQNQNQNQTASARSDSSTPSVSITPAQQEMDPFDFELDLPAQPQSQTTQAPPAASAGQWKPGQSIPVDLARLQREFQEAAMRNRTQSVPNVAHHMASHQFLEQPLAYPSDEAYPRRESSTTHITRTMQNFSMGNQRAAMPSTSIAARRQRPKPAPLGGASLRSVSYAGQLPTSPGPVTSSHPMPSAGQTLRRIKSSQAMNGIANGRIQKNIGAAQRSPSGVAFADAAAATKYARRVASFSHAFTGIPPIPSAGLAPPTPMSPSSYASLQQGPRPMRQESMSDSEIDPLSHSVPSNNFSPPSTPVYATQFSRSRLGSIAVAESTPPQSAPATQQTFSNPVYQSSAAQMQNPMSSVPMLQSNSHHGFVPIMTNEYQPMSNAMFANQQQPAPNQYMEMPMSYIMTNTGEVHMGYALGASFGQQQVHQATPPNHQHPFVPSSNSSPDRKQSNPPADFFVHEYTPPQDVKQVVTPRKPTESGPKNYTFSNHGPEYFERNVKKNAEHSSPASSVGGSSTA